MTNKEQRNRQFKANENSGEHRNGRKSQYKNHNSVGGDSPNEYVSNKNNEDV